MRRFAEFAMWARALFRRARVESEMEREMRAHIDMETAENIRRGMKPADARRAALIAFGGLDRAKEDVRDERGTRWIEDAISDVAFTLRGIRRAPLFTATMVTLLAVGIGGNSAMFTLIHRVLISPMDYPDGDRMVEVVATSAKGRLSTVPRRQFIDDWRARGKAMEEVLILDDARVVLGDTLAPKRDTARATSIVPGTLAYTSTRPLLGRDVGPADTANGAPPVVLIGYAVWQRRFAGSDSVLGKSLAIDGVSHTIIGVLPDGFQVPFMLKAQVFPALQSRDTSLVYAIAKLREGRSTDDVNSELAAVWKATVRFGLQQVDDVPTVKRAVDEVSESRRETLQILFSAVGVILLIACANVANLLLTRAWSRRREFAIRAALGAGRGRLLRQIFTESLLLASISGAAGLLVTLVTLKLLSVYQPGDLGDPGAVRVDAVVLWWTLGVSMLTGVLFGLAPAVLASAGRLDEMLKSGARTSTGHPFTRALRSGFVVFEVALSVVLLVSAGLLVRSIVSMQRADVGFDVPNLHRAFVRFPRKTFDTDEKRVAAVSAEIGTVKALPGVEGASFSSVSPPFFIHFITVFEFEGFSHPPDDSIRALSINHVRPDYFKVAGIRLLHGRMFNEPVRGAKTGELIASQSLAKHFWPNGDAVGKHIQAADWRYEIVGIAPDVAWPGREFRRSEWQVWGAYPEEGDRGYVMFRSPRPVGQLIPLVRQAMQSAVPESVVDDATSVERSLENGRAQHRFMLRLVGGFAGVALLLALVGLHAVISFAVKQRTREIGVRIALGAQPADVIGMVLRQGLALAAAGSVVGAVGALGATRLLGTLLYGVSGRDPLTIAAVVALMLGTALVASWMPARLAMAVDPATVLRSE